MSATRILIVVLVIALIGWGIWAYSKKPAVEQRDTNEATVKLQAGNTNSDLDRDLATIDGQISASEQSSRDVEEGNN